MNFSVIGKHRDFFRLHHWIECEEVLAPATLAKVNVSIAAAKSKTGRDLWRGSSSLKRVFLQKGLAGIASDLIECRPLRFGYDQYLTPTSSFLPESPCSLLDISSFQGVLCGMILCLTQPKESFAVESSVFPQKAGNAIFFAPDFPIAFPTLKRLDGASYILLVYVQKSAVYCKQSRDPHGNELKQFGYDFGDRLKDSLNPIVYE